MLTNLAWFTLVKLKDFHLIAFIFPIYIDLLGLALIFFASIILKIYNSQD